MTSFMDDSTTEQLWVHFTNKLAPSSIHMAHCRIGAILIHNFTAYSFIHSFFQVTTFLPSIIFLCHCYIFCCHGEIQNYLLWNQTKILLGFSNCLSWRTIKIIVGRTAIRLNFQNLDILRSIWCLKVYHN